jgi:hypothetical protein
MYFGPEFERIFRLFLVLAIAGACFSVYEFCRFALWLYSHLSIAWG